MAEMSKDIAAIDNHSNPRDFPRSPASISPDPSSRSRRDSLRPLKSSKRSDSSAPSDSSPPPSMPMRLTRKRAASLNTEAANIIATTENLGPNSARPSTGIPHNGVREQVCLCQPDPKIPRPRNAFILYRQHYQAQVVAQHPGLANPEISKIIGEQWRDQAVEVKNEWKRLAEEEKQRHQRQYPDYRYQPRRAGKANARPISSSSGDDPGRCPKCGGRYISTPSTPLTPFPPQYQVHNPHGIANNNQPRMQPNYGRPTTPNHDQQVYHQMTSPRSAPLHPSMRGHRSHYSVPIVNSVQLNTLRERDTEMDSASPDFKRRRFNDNVAPQASPRNYLPQSPYGGPAQDPRRMPINNGRPPMATGGWIEDRRSGMPLPSPGQLIHHQQHTGSMEPPPRPAPLMQHYPQHPVHIPTPRPDTRSPVFDESLRLPPLQTSLSSTITSSTTQPQTHQESHARSVQAMVMTIPYLNKIKVLSKISPSLSAPSATSPAQETRGAVVAIEGSDTAAVAEVGRYIQEYLSKETEIALQAWQDTSSHHTSTTQAESRKPKLIHQNSDEMTSPTVSHSSSQGEASEAFIHTNESFKKYLTTILSWHHKSREIQKFITTIPLASDAETTGATMPISPSTTVTSLPSPDPAASTPPVTTTTTTSTSAPLTSRTNTIATSNRIPVALLPNGYSLSISDHYASRIPINDDYAPVDHWQWTATLWRGIVGPDLTIYVTSGGSGSVNSGGGGKEDAASTGVGGGVEVRNDCSAIVVKSEEGRGVEEKCLRRLGFEVLEFVRGFGGAGGM